MLSLNEARRLYFCSEQVTFRVRHKGIRAYIKSQLGREPTNGDAYIFMSANSSRIRVYYFNNGGEVLVEKILYGSKFIRPVYDENSKTHHMSWTDFQYLVEGIIRKDNRVKLQPETSSEYIE